MNKETAIAPLPASILKASTLPDTLTVVEKKEAKDMESVIEVSLKAVSKLGPALRAFRDAKLYRDQYKTIEEYCERRWGICRSRAYQLIEYAVITDNLSTGVDKERLPVNEAQVRPLARIKEPEKQVEVWNGLVAAANGKSITRAHVEKAVKEVVKPAAKEKPKPEVVKVVDLEVVPPETAISLKPVVENVPVKPEKIADATLTEALALVKKLEGKIPTSITSARDVLAELKALLIKLGSGS